MNKQVEQLHQDLLNYGLIVQDKEGWYQTHALRQRIIILDDIEYHHTMRDGELINLYSITDGTINLIYCKF